MTWLFVQRVVELISGWNGIDLKSNERKAYCNLSGKREDILVCLDENWKI